MAYVMLCLYLKQFVVPAGGDKLTFSFHLKRIKEGSKSSNRTSAVQMKLLQTNLLTQEGSVLVLFIYVIKGHLNAATYDKKQ